jgi:hypothetical protein
VNLNLIDRPTLKKTLAGAAALLIAALGMLVFGGDEERDRRVVDQLCRAGLDEISVDGGVDLCLKEPDPRPQLDPPAAASSLTPNTFYRQSRLCPGDGVSGHRIRIYVGAPSDRPAASEAQVRAVRTQLGYAERVLHESSPDFYQKLNYYCATDAVPTISTITFPPVGSDGRWDFSDLLNGIQSVDPPQPRIIYHGVVMNVGDAYPFGGQGTVMECDLAAPPQSCLDARQYSMTAVAGPPSNFGDIILHELGHNMGAVALAAHHSTGSGWHCTDLGETMCYDDGGSGVTAENPMEHRCGPVTWKGRTLEPFDCDGDFWDPSKPLTGYFAEHFNVANSPYLTKPRHK